VAEAEDGEVLQLVEPPRNAAGEVVLVEEGDGEGAAVAERAGYPARERVVAEAEVRPRLAGIVPEMPL
jgi:hypothetical protein